VFFCKMKAVIRIEKAAPAKNAGFKTYLSARLPPKRANFCAQIS